MSVRGYALHSVCPQLAPHLIFGYFQLQDLVLDVLFVIMYVFAFILLCVVCGFPSDHAALYSDPLIAAVVSKS